MDTTPIVPTPPAGSDERTELAASLRVTGQVFTALAYLGGALVWVALQGTHMSCSPETDTQSLADLRKDVILLGLAVAILPALFALGARLDRGPWRAWAAAAAFPVGLAVFNVVTTSQVAHWCF